MIVPCNLPLAPLDRIAQNRENDDIQGIYRGIRRINDILALLDLDIECNLVDRLARFLGLLMVGGHAHLGPEISDAENGIGALEGAPEG